MNDEVKEQIAEILCAIYQIPGEFFIGGLIAKYIGESMITYSQYGFIFLIMGYFLFALEGISPFIAGIKLYENGVNNIRYILEKIK